MLAKNTDDETLRTAMRMVNSIYGRNITWNRSPEARGKHLRFTLRVRKSDGPGAKRAASGRRSISACWHVHGDFFDIVFRLSPDAVFVMGDGSKITKDSGNWVDRNIGSILQPVMHSKACDCVKEFDSEAMETYEKEVA